MASRAQNLHQSSFKKVTNYLVLLVLQASTCLSRFSTILVSGIALGLIPI